MIKNKNHWKSFGTGRCEVGKKCFQYVNYKGKSILSFPTKNSLDNWGQSKNVATVIRISKVDLGTQPQDGAPVKKLPLRYWQG